MTDTTNTQIQRCFISAPFGLELGALPTLLEERGISWEWAKFNPDIDQDIRSRIASVDFALVVLNGTSSDYRGSFDAGVALGLGKPVLIVQTKARALPLDFRQFTVVKSSLSNREALGFHLDLFLAASTVQLENFKTERPPREQTIRSSKERDSKRNFASELERRAYRAVIAAGGSAISEPRSDTESRYRPDLLAWLGNLDSELLDPVVIEVRSEVDTRAARRIEEQLLSFMHNARIKTALVLTNTPPPEREQQLSPNILWLTIGEFETLSREANLGKHIRETRNRIMHGVR